MLFRDISYLELWQPFCSGEYVHLCNFGKGYYEEQFCEIILNFDHWLWRKCCLTIFLILSSGSPIVQWSRTVCAIFVQGVMRNNSVKLFEFGPVGKILFKIFLIWRTGDPPVWWSGTIYANLEEGIIGIIHVKLFGPVVQEMLLKKKQLQLMDAQRTKTITIAHLGPSAQLS